MRNVLIGALMFVLGGLLRGTDFFHPVGPAPA